MVADPNDRIGLTKQLEWILWIITKYSVYRCLRSDA